MAAAAPPWGKVTICPVPLTDHLPSLLPLISLEPLPLSPKDALPSPLIPKDVEYPPLL